VGRTRRREALRDPRAPALKAEKWFWRFVDRAERDERRNPGGDLASYGMAAMAIIDRARGERLPRGRRRLVKLEPLLDELLECVKIVRNPKANDRATGQPHATPLVGDDDIEEVKTIIWLRSEVLRVHSNFSLADGLLTLVSAITKPSEENSPTT
jgi:hypothetical protein